MIAVLVQRTLAVIGPADRHIRTLAHQELVTLADQEVAGRRIDKDLLAIAAKTR